ncbi:MAG: AbrB family transcriptional regulator [Pseudomonadota bacterium]
MSKTLIATARTLSIAAGGALLALVLDLPLPFLIGPLLMCLFCALGGIHLSALPRTAATLRSVLGVAVGASITPDVVQHVGDFAVSVGLVIALTLMIALVGVPWFLRCGFDRSTAFYAAMPGGLQDMLLFGIEAGGNPRALSLAHATRLAVVVASLPFLLTGVFGVSLDNPPGAPAVTFTLYELALLLFCALGGWALGKKLSMPGATILGPLVLTAALSLAGVVEKRPPSEVILAAQFVIGLSVGVHYVGITVRELRDVVLAALGYSLLTGALTAAVIYVVVALGLAPLTDAMLGFSPGGQAEMTVLAIVAGAELSYVVTLHLSRIVLVIVGAPFLHRWMYSRRGP